MHVHGVALREYGRALCSRIPPGMGHPPPPVVFVYPRDIKFWIESVNHNIRQVNSVGSGLS